MGAGPVPAGAASGLHVHALACHDDGRWADNPLHAVVGCDVPVAHDADAAEGWVGV